MLRTPLLLIAVVCLAAITAVAQGTTEELLPAGMLLQCTLDEPRFSSSTAEIGDLSFAKTRSRLGSAMLSLEPTS